MSKVNLSVFNINPCALIIKQIMYFTHTSVCHECHTVMSYFFSPLKYGEERIYDIGVCWSEIILYRSVSFSGISEIFCICFQYCYNSIIRECKLSSRIFLIGFTRKNIPLRQFLRKFLSVEPRIASMVKTGSQTYQFMYFLGVS